MNLNDFRASAYKNQSQNDDNVKESKQHVVKAFEPIKLTKDFNSSENSKIDKKNLTETRNEVVNKNKVKEFSPKDDIVHSKENNSQYDSTEILKNSGLLKVPVAEKEKDGKESIYRRVAKFLVLIGEDEAAKILPHLSEVQIEKIIPEIASIRTVSKDESSVILAEFKSLLDDSRKSGGIETARDILQKAYGKKRADEMLEKSVPFEGKIPFNYLNDADNERIYQLLKDENEGIKAIVLSYLKPKKAASVINLMKSDEKKETVLRLAKMEPVSPEVIRRIDNAMHEKSLHQTSDSVENIDGRNVLAQILKKMSPDSESEIL
ncbi:MAG: flagellar motor switch protein FliG [Treponema sp.]|nr:flagellar motor switch protein FliG [Treponema sp.]